MLIENDKNIHRNFLNSFVSLLNSLALGGARAGQG
jgi:hypothetical protein